MVRLWSIAATASTDSRGPVIMTNTPPTARIRRWSERDW